MQHTEFEPFGEALGQRGSSHEPIALKQGAVQRAVLRSGVGIFWALLAGIVIARAMYFNPNFAETFQHVAMIIR